MDSDEIDGDGTLVGRRDKGLFDRAYWQIIWLLFYKRKEPCIGCLVAAVCDWDCDIRRKYFYNMDNTVDEFGFIAYWLFMALSALAVVSTLSYLWDITNASVYWKAWYDVRF